MAEIYFLKLNDLDNPIFNPPQDIMLTYNPFYHDYYSTIYLKRSPKRQCGYKPLLVNDRVLLENYGANNLSYLVANILDNTEVVKGRYYKIQYSLLSLVNGWFAIYMEKSYQWGCFISRGVIVIMSQSKTAVIDYFERTMGKPSLRGFAPSDDEGSHRQR